VWNHPSHEPSRSLFLAILAAVESAAFLFLLCETDPTKGNLSVYLSKLEEAGYVSIDKTYRGKATLKLFRMTYPTLKVFEIYRNQFKQFVENTKE